ncbi:xylosylprotein 4-beta-galactosyltransferase [Cimex lectularius]|uniref:Beta-1,4-N-acetylgalactosaminyltransferase n=1 Tax=Cimex lectularius TaxID=79782 RepID=A0A8I6RFC4_CIMLE|nr:xylosylprotein 4-beta-galactosyltransferase [Cimex lectularius]
MYISLFKTVRFRYLFMCIFTTFLLGCAISLYSIPTGAKEVCECKEVVHEDKEVNSEHTLGVVVPFRERLEELLEFAPHIRSFLNKQKVKHKIFVINQVDQYRFNRASLINVGFKIATDEGCDYIVMHDVDLLPLNPALPYTYPKNGLFHVASPEIHPRYHYPTFVGGILIIKKEDFMLVNGMSNKYWGWGLEDDEFFLRLKEAGLNISRPSNLTTGIENTFRHIHDRVWRKRDMVKCFNQKEVTRRRDRVTGLKDVSYYIKSRQHLTIEGASLTMINTLLRCNRTITPWCLCSEERKNKIDKSPRFYKKSSPIR